ncbi:hypothetical protein EDB19DRAFT_2045834 [Suillus lakei]|nr:hypothetical protein EDB19DRAFT_2045834 [Suillus lakei]
MYVSTLQVDNSNGRELYHPSCAGSTIQLYLVLQESVLLVSFSPLFPTDSVPIMKHTAQLSDQACWIAQSDVRESTRRETLKPDILPSTTPTLPPRSLSPASSSSSLSTSTRTVAPVSPRPKITRQQSAASTSAVSDATITKSPRQRHGKSTPRGSPSTSLLRSSRIPRDLLADHGLTTVHPSTHPVIYKPLFHRQQNSNSIHLVLLDSSSIFDHPEAAARRNTRGPGTKEAAGSTQGFYCQTVMERVGEGGSGYC